MQHHLASLLMTALLIVAGLPGGSISTLSPSTHVVGHGHPSDCTEATLFAALDLGGAITFDCGPAPLPIVFDTTRTITATASLNGGDLITLSGNNNFRLFYIPGGFSLTLSHIALSHAKVFGDDGGAIYNDTGATLIVDHATFSNNKTDPAYSGGAIFSNGTLTISDSVFDSNQAGNGGALNPRDGSTTTIRNTVFSHNSAINPTNGWGGALLVWHLATVNVSDSQFISNTARWGGAVYVYPSSSLTLTNSLLTNNLADSDSSTDGGGGAIYNNARLVLAGTSIENNLTVVPGSSFFGVRAGGGIWNSTSGSIQMTGGALSGNRALHGGAMYSLGNVSIASATLANNLAGRGGAIENANNAANSLVISATTLSSNEVSTALYPAITTALGSAIFNTAHLDLTNSTLSGNSGKEALQEDNSVITLTNVTLAQNPNGGLGSDQFPNTSQVGLFNTLLASNGSDNCSNILFGTFTSESSLSSDNTCAYWTGSDNQDDVVDPRISPLGNHGGPTQTHMLAANSPAVDAGANCPLFDQRGVLRQQPATGSACDIGAVERLANDAFFKLFLPLARR